MSCKKTIPLKNDIHNRIVGCDSREDNRYMKRRVTTMTASLKLLPSFVCFSSATTRGRSERWLVELVSLFCRTSFRADRGVASFASSLTTMIRLPMLSLCDTSTRNLCCFLLRSSTALYERMVTSLSQISKGISCQRTLSLQSWRG